MFYNSQPTYLRPVSTCCTILSYFNTFRNKSTKIENYFFLKSLFLYNLSHATLCGYDHIPAPTNKKPSSLSPSLLEILLNTSAHQMPANKQKQNNRRNTTPTTIKQTHTALYLIFMLKRKHNTISISLDWYLLQ